MALGGISVTMSDTPANQAVYPQHGGINQIFSVRHLKVSSVRHAVQHIDKMFLVVWTCAYARCLYFYGS
jgi:hypothetical protein